MKQEELKPKEAKPIEYNDYFLKRLAEVRENNQTIDFNNLTYNFKGPEHVPINFIRFKGPNHIFKSIYDSDKALEDVEKEQIKFKSDIGCINQGNPKHKSPEQTQTKRKIENFYNSREEVVKIFLDYAKNMSRNIYKSEKEQDLKY